MEEERIDSGSFSLFDLVTFGSRPTEWQDGRYLRLSKLEVERIYRTWLGRKICDAFPNEATRRMIDIKIALSGRRKVDVSVLLQQEELLKKQLQDLQVLRKMNEAMSLANLYGGSAIVIITEDATPYSQPINPKKLKQIKKLEVLSRYQIKPFVQGYLSDPYRPEKYQLIPSDPAKVIRQRSKQGVVVGSEWIIDASRVIRFDGVRTPPDIMRATEYWGDSIFQGLHNEILEYLKIYTKISELITNPNPFVHQIDGLREILATKGRDKVKEYLKAVYEAKMHIGGLVIDKTDTFTYVNRSFAELANLLDRYGNKLVAATNIPYSILFGKGAEGLAAGGTGETEKGIFHQNVMQYQEIVLRPALEMLIRLLFQIKNSPTGGEIPEDWHLQFKPLESPNLKDELTAKQLQAQIDASYLQLQVVTPQEVRKSRFGGAEFSYDLTLESKELPPQAGQPMDGTQTPPPEVIQQLQAQLRDVDDETLLRISQVPQLQPFEVELVQAEIMRRQQEGERSRLAESEQKKDSIFDDEDDAELLAKVQEFGTTHLHPFYDHLINDIRLQMRQMPPDSSLEDILTQIDNMYSNLPIDKVASALQKQMLISALSQKMLPPLLGGDES